MKGWYRSIRKSEKGYRGIRKAVYLLAALLLPVFPARSVLTAEAGSGAETGAEKSRQVVFTGDSLESDFSEENFAQAAYELQPGESIVLSVILKNEDTSSSDWYMTNEVLESLEDNSYAKGGAYTYILTYTGADGTDRILYSSMTVGGEGSRTESDRQGLHQAVEGLEDAFYLDRLGAGENGRLSLEVGLDGETQGNDYQNTLARLRFHFAVEGEAEENSTSSKNIQNSSNRKNSEKSANSTDSEDSENSTRTVYRSEDVKTGDENRMLGWSAAALGSALLLLYLGRKKKKDGGKGNEPERRMLLYLIVLCCLAVSGEKGTVQAGNYEDTAYRANWSGSYTYQVVFHAGNQGTFTGTEHVNVIAAENGESREKPEIRLSEDRRVIVVKGLKKGDRISFDAALEGALSLHDSGRYYVQGIRLSGRDNDTVSVTSFEVSGERERDLDYVVAYGIRRDMTAYTIRYLDSYGNTLAESQTRYGSVGDQAMAAYRHVEGYVPQAYNMTKTLVKNEAFNVFTFVYTPVRTGEAGENEVNEETEIEEETEADEETEVKEETEVNEETEIREEIEVNEDVEIEEEREETGENERFGETGEEMEGPLELLELDDEGVPLAGGRNEREEDNGANAEKEEPDHSKTDRTFLWTATAVCIAAVLILFFLLLHIFQKREKRDEEKAD